MADASLAISPFLGGDPVCLGPEIASPGDAGSVTLRWVNLAHRPRLMAGLPPVEAAVVLIAPVADSARALRLVGRLMACLGEPAILDRACAATTREALVEALAPAERSAGEGSLGAPQLLR